MKGDIAPLSEQEFNVCVEHWSNIFAAPTDFQDPYAELAHLLGSSRSRAKQVSFLYIYTLNSVVSKWLMERDRQIMFLARKLVSHKVYRTIGEALNESDDYAEKQVAALQARRSALASGLSSNVINLTAESFDKVAELIANPPELTQAMKDAILASQEGTMTIKTEGRRK